jgi:DHA1 family bicyclomycin/chloramphenicol resistance-like MFS transporter
MHAGAAAGRYLSRLMLIVGLGPIVAPIVGGPILRFTSWRDIFVALAILGLVLAATTARFLPETFPPSGVGRAGSR